MKTACELIDERWDVIIVSNQPRIKQTMIIEVDLPRLLQKSL